jgi:hypothetical protein
MDNSFSYNLGNWPESFYEITANDLATKKRNGIRMSFYVHLYTSKAALIWKAPFSYPESGIMIPGFLLLPECICFKLLLCTTLINALFLEGRQGRLSLVPHHSF